MGHITCERGWVEARVTQEGRLRLKIWDDDKMRYIDLTATEARTVASELVNVIHEMESR